LSPGLVASFMSDILPEFKALTRRFGSFTAVDALTLSVNAGEVLGLLGSNGAGRTTTIKTLTVLLPPSSGEACVAGFSITTQAVGVRRAIGYLPQAVSVDGSLAGYANLLIFAKLYDLPHREQRGRIRVALGFMDLTADGGRLLSQYSGGMVRRLEIAQSTLHRLRALILDEPAVGLDPIARDAVGSTSLICRPTAARPCSSPPITWRRRRANVTAWRSCTWQDGCARHLPGTRGLA